MNIESFSKHILRRSLVGDWKRGEAENVIISYLSWDWMGLLDVAFACFSNERTDNHQSINENPCACALSTLHKGRMNRILFKIVMDCESCYRFTKQKNGFYNST